MSKREESTQGRVAARRARFRSAVVHLSERARSTELLRMLLLPGAFALVAGFVVMFLGWYGASRTARLIEQVPYLISGGLIGLGLVFVGALLVASAFWMSMLQRFSDQAEDRSVKRVAELESRLREEQRGPGRASRRAPSRSRPR